MTRSNGNPALLVSIFKSGDANTVTTADAVFAVLEQYKEDHPSFEYAIAFEQATFIRDAIEGVSNDGIRGGAFAIIVILIFLSGRVQGKYKLSWQATLVTGISIPLSVLTALFLCVGFRQ
ncbi:MAG: efflux RND transporter permease subunit [Chloroflexi bacterium]|nr:efflux RND transporter permease subunit [Chloroflexota bacterium]